MDIITIIDKIKGLLDENNCVSYKNLVEFVEIQSNHTLGCNMCLEDVTSNGYFLFKSSYRDMLCSILVSINVDKTKKYEMDSKLQVRSVSILFS